ncbi:MAG: DUF4214 domain-containing protein [Lachnospiraceae bacterium]|nr:DUF4214 domain-containing protein [Lachnospiraceae bacterium]
MYMKWFRKDVIRKICAWLLIILLSISCNLITPKTVYADTTSQIQGFVARLYNVCLSRTPDAEGINYWVNILTTNQKSGSEVAANFIFSEEFKNKNLCDSCYIDSLYRCFMGREADSAGKSYWLGQLSNGVTRGEVFNGFSRSQEFGNICSSYGVNRGTGDWSKTLCVLTGNCSACGAANQTVNDFVTRLYDICLNRAPDAGGLAYWASQAKNGKSGAEIAYGFVFSTEFKNNNLCNEHFVECMYRAFFGREYDAGGKAYWLAKLNSGATKGEIYSGFVSSKEFQQLCAGCGIRVGNTNYNASDFGKYGTCKICSSNNVAQYSYSLSILNQYDIYSGGTVILALRTNNPDINTIYTDYGTSDMTMVIAPLFNDVKYYDNSIRTSSWQAIQSQTGYIRTISYDTAGTYTIKVTERIGDRQVVVANLTVTVKDRTAAENAWYDSVIASETNSSMTDQQKMSALCSYVMKNFKYDANDGTYLVFLTTNVGPWWEVKQIDCWDATDIMCDFASRLGLKSEWTYGNYLNHYYATVYIDGVGYEYDASPYSDSNIVTEWDYVLE